MSVISCGATRKRTGESNGDGLRYKTDFVAETDDANDDQLVVLLSGLVPQVGVEDGSNPGAYVTLVTCEQTIQSNVREAGAVVPGGGTWKVVATYSTIESEVQAARSPLYPTMPAAYNGSGTLEEVPTDFDKNDDPIANFAGDPYFPPVNRWEADVVLEITVNLLAINVPDPDFYSGKVNSEAYKGKAPGTVMCLGIVNTGPFRKASTSYYTSKITVGFKRRGWLKRILNAGLREKLNGKLKVVTIDGREITTPLPLLEANDFGVVRAIRDGDMSQATFSEYETQDDVSFSALNY